MHLGITPKESRNWRRVASNGGSNSPMWIMESVSTGSHSRLQNPSRSITDVKTFISPAANQFSYCGTTALNPEATQRSSPDEEGGGGGRDACPPLKPHSLAALPAWMRLLSVESKAKRRYPQTNLGEFSLDVVKTSRLSRLKYTPSGQPGSVPDGQQRKSGEMRRLWWLCSTTRATAWNGAQVPLKRTISGWMLQIQLWVTIPRHPCLTEETGE